MKFSKLGYQLVQGCLGTRIKRSIALDRAVALISLCSQADCNNLQFLKAASCKSDTSAVNRVKSLLWSVEMVRGGTGPKRPHRESAGVALGQLKQMWILYLSFHTCKFEKAAIGLLGHDHDRNKLQKYSTKFFK